MVIFHSYVRNYQRVISSDFLSQWINYQKSALNPMKKPYLPIKTLFSLMIFRARNLHSVWGFPSHVTDDTRGYIWGNMIWIHCIDIDSHLDFGILFLEKSMAPTPLAAVICAKIMCGSKHGDFWVLQVSVLYCRKWWVPQIYCNKCKISGKDFFSLGNILEGILWILWEGAWCAKVFVIFDIWDFVNDGFLLETYGK